MSLFPLIYFSLGVQFTKLLCFINLKLSQLAEFVLAIKFLISNYLQYIYIQNKIIKDLKNILLMNLNLTLQK